VNDDELLGALGDALTPPAREVPADRLAALRALAAEHGSTPPSADGSAGGGSGAPGDGSPAPVVPIASRRTLLVGSIAAAVGAVAGVAATVAATNDDGGSGEVAGPPTGPFEVTSLAPGAIAEARTIDHTWGLELLLDIEGLPVERTYAVSFATADGAVSAGGFRSVDVLMRCRFNATALLAEVTEVTIADEATGDIVLRGRPA
jgi:hypothetical protein